MRSIFFFSWALLGIWNVLLSQDNFFRTKVDALVNKGDVTHARQLCEKELSLPNNEENQIWAITLLGEIALIENEPKQAEAFYEKAFQLLNTNTISDPIKFEILQRQVIFYSNTGSHEKAMQVLLISLRLAQLNQNTDQIKDLYNQLYSNYYSLGRLDSAIYYFTALMELKENEDSNEWINDWSVIGKLYTEKGDYVLAQRYLTKALREAENKADTFFMMSLYTDIASVYANEKNWENANIYAQKGAELAVQKSVKLIEALNLHIQAQAAYQLNAPQAAIGKYKAALDIFRSLNHTIQIANIYLELGRIYQNKEDYKSAMQNVKEALNMRQGMSDAIGTLNAKLLEAEIKLQFNRLYEAIEILESCLEQSRLMKHESARSQTYLLLSKAYIQLARYKEGHTFLVKYQTLHDSLASLERSRMINEMGILYETEKKDNELALKQAEIEIQENKIRRRNNQLLLLLSILGFVCLSLILLYVNYQRKRQLAEQRFEVMKKDQETKRLIAMIEGEDKERRRIARDLHDDFGALLATAKHRIHAIENEIPAIKYQLSYQKATQLIDQACAKVREISHNMIPSILDQYGLEYAVNEICQTIVKDYAIEVDFIPYGLEQEMDAAMKVNIFRIIQELLRNVVNHAQAKSVIVQLTLENNNINLVVEDDGVGFDPLHKKGNGIGLDNIISRVKYLSGEIFIDSIPDKGSTFTINIPFINEFPIVKQ